MCVRERERKRGKLIFVTFLCVCHAVITTPYFRVVRRYPICRSVDTDTPQCSVSPWRLAQITVTFTVSQPLELNVSRARLWWPASPEPDRQRLLLGLGVKLTSQELGDYQIQRQLSSGAAVTC